MLPFVIIKNLGVIMNLAKVPGDQISLFRNSQLQSLSRQSGPKYLKLSHHLLTSLETDSELSAMSYFSYQGRSVLGKVPPTYQFYY